MLLTRRLPDFPGGVGVEGGDRQADDQVWPRRAPDEGGNQSRADDGDVGQGVVARRQDGRPRQAPRPWASSECPCVLTVNA